MKKILIFIIVLFAIIIFITLKLPNNSSLGGFYQNDMISEGYTIAISIQPEEKSFVEYINNREVNSGTFEELGNKRYKLIGNNRNIDIELAKNNSFEITIKKINDEIPIVLKNINNVPIYYTTQFDDVDEYISLLKE